MTFDFYNVFIVKQKRKIMEKVKKEKTELLSTLKVDKETHTRVKEFCENKNYWMCRFVESVLNDYLDKHDNTKS